MATINGKQVISQSLIKALDPEKNKCPSKAKAVYIDDMPTEPSFAMLRGLYFEQAAGLGTEGDIEVHLPRTTTGAKKVDQQRLDLHAHRFRTKIKAEQRMDFKRVREKIVAPINEKFVFRARIDLVSSLLDGNGVFHEEVIIDTKITESLLNNYGEFSWAFPEGMDHIQAYAYTWAYQVKYKRRVPFYYLVMDLSPSANYRFIGGTVNDTHYAEFREAVRRTIASIEHFQETGWPLVPSADNCRGCPLRNECPGARTGANFQTIW